MKRFIMDGNEYTATELATILANGSLINPYRGDMDTYYSIIFFINDLINELKKSGEE